MSLLLFFLSVNDVIPYQRQIEKKHEKYHQKKNERKKFIIREVLDANRQLKKKRDSQQNCTQCPDTSTSNV